MREHPPATRAVAVNLMVQVPATSDLLVAYRAARTDDAALCVAIADEIVSWWQEAGCQARVDRCMVVSRDAGAGGGTPA